MEPVIIFIFFSSMFLIFWIWLSIVLWSLRNGISPMPTSEKVKRQVLASIPPDTQGTIVDLGSGWGTMANQIARLLPHCEVVGYETSPIPFLVSRLISMVYKQPNLKFYRKNFFNVPLNNTSLVYCYLYPDAMKKLADKFNHELKPGTIVISNTFAVPGWDPVSILEVQDMYHTRIYVYVKSNSYVEALQAKPIKQEPVGDKSLV